MALGHGNPFCYSNTDENTPDCLSDLWCEVPSQKFRGKGIDGRKIARELRGGEVLVRFETIERVLQLLTE